jgi:hypothetical protein
MNKYILCVFLFVNVVASTFANEVAVQLDREKVALNESFTAQFTAFRKIQGQPDFSPLQTDFDILSVSTSLRSAFINGKITEETNWILHLMAKHEGKLTIPAIAFGQDSSLPKLVEVSQSDPAKQDETIFIEIELNPNSSVYIETPLICTVRLYCSLQLSHGTLSEIKTNDSDAIIERVGKDNQYEKFYKNGKRYIVVERQYMIIPQHAGELVISPVIFEGSIMARNFSMFDMQSDFRRVNSEAQKIEVKKAPFGVNPDKWFAANDVKLTEKLSKDLSTLKIGEPVTWTITLIADGVLSNQIPDFDIQAPKDFKFYIDKPELNNEITASGVVAKKEIKIAIIPLKTGEFTLPELKVEWWNLKIDQKNSSELPLKTIIVASDEVAMTKPAETLRVNSLDELDPIQEPLNATLSFSEDKSYWSLLLCTLTGVIAIAGILMYTKLKLNNPALDSLRVMKRNFKLACRSSDTKKAEKYLLACSHLIFPESRFSNLMLLKPLYDQKISEEIDVLYQALYGYNRGWDGAALWEAFNAFKPLKIPKSDNNKKSNTLEKLYP